MKNSILSSVVLAAFLASPLLTSASLYCMQLTTVEGDSSDETEGLNVEERSEQFSGWSVRAFLASPFTGARELLRSGRRAAAYLVGNDSSMDNCEEGDCKQKDENATLISLFLNNPEEYAGLAESLPQDKRWLLARYLLLNHPLAKVIRERLGRHVCLHTLRHDHLVSVAHFNGAGDRIVTASKDSTAKIWDVATGECLHTLQGHSDWVHSAQFNGAGDRIVTACNDRTAKIWDVASGRCLHRLESHGLKLSVAQFNRAGDKIVTTSFDNTAKIWDVASGRCLHTLQCHVAQFNGAGDRIVTACNDGTAKIWEVVSGECLHTLEGDRGSVCAAQFNSAGDRIIVTASADRTVKIWDVASGTCLHTLQGHKDYVYAPEFNGSGDRIVTASDDGTAKIWSVQSGECIHTLQSHGGSVCSAQFNGAGDRIVTASADFTTKIWDVHSGECLYTLGGHGARVNSAQFNGAGDNIVTASCDETAKIWDVGRLFAATAWLERGCTLEQALLLHCIYEIRIAHALLKKQKSWFYTPSALRFDFSKCPHLQEYFDTMPLEVQACLEPFIIKKV